MDQNVNQTDKKYTQYSKPYPRWAVDALEEVYKEPEGSPKRWRKAAAVCLNLNPLDSEDGLTAKQQYIEAKKMAAEARMDLKNKFGEIDPKGGTGVRDELIMPAVMWTWIKMFDAMAFDQSNPDCKKNLGKLRQEFKELTVAEAF